MGMFDGVTQMLLRPTASGLKVFTLWGRPPRRFIVSAEREAALKRLESRFYVAALVILVGSMQLVPWGYVMGLGVPLMVAAHLILLARFAKTLQPTDEAPLPTTPAQLEAKYARATGRGVQLFALIVSAMFVALGFYLLLHNPHAIVGWFTIAFFGWGTLAAWRRLKLVDRQS